MLWMLGISIRRNFTKYTLALVALAAAVAISCLGMSGVNLLMKIARRPVTQFLGGDLMALDDSISFVGGGGYIWLPSDWQAFDAEPALAVVKSVIGSADTTMSLVTSAYVPRMGAEGSIQRILGRYDPTSGGLYSPSATLGTNVVGTKDAEYSIHVPSYYTDGSWGDVGATHSILFGKIVEKEDGQQIVDIAGGQSAKMTVSGVYDSDYTMKWPYAPLALVQELSDAQGKVSWIGVCLPDLSREERVRETLAAALGDAGLGLQVIDAESMANVIMGEISHLRSTASLYFPVAALISSFIVVATSFSMLLSRRREIAVLRAIGESKNQVAALFVAEIAIVSLIGGTLGYLGCSLFAPVLVHASAFINPLPVFTSVGIAVLVSAIATRSRAFADMAWSLRNQ